MAKVLLVEDDNNLREIFEMRLQAEGYETLSASDGEEALVIATQQKPDLIIADIMMPKLSGFEMLETLRAAPEMSDVKVIAMTALGQAEDRARGEKLGVVKYLVKSQVTLEDFARVVREVLPPDKGGQASTGVVNSQQGQGKLTTNNQESEQKMPDDTLSTNPTPSDDSTPPTNPVSGDSPGAAPPDDQMTTEQEQSVVNNQVNDFTAGAPAAGPSQPADSAPAIPPTEPTSGTGGAPASEPSFPTPEPTAPPADGSPQPPVEETKPDEGPSSPSVPPA